MSADPEQEYFCEGMSEELINALSKLEGLKVASRTAAFQFRGRGYDLHEIGRKLNVETVLEGSVRKSSNRLRITAQLVNVADGYHLWSERYDREMDDVFSVQDEITLAILENLKPKLMQEGKERIAKRKPVDPEAYNLYLKGRFFWKKRTEEGERKAITYFEKAIQKEPDYALAYSALSDSYNSLVLHSSLPPWEAFPKARQTALKALDLDDTLAEAHTSLATVKMNFDRDWKGAERDIKKAIELDPEYAYVHYVYSIYLTYMGHHKESIREMERALELDPLSLNFNRALADVNYWAGRYDQAIEQCVKTIEMDPSYRNVHLNLGLAYLAKSEYENALKEIDKEKQIIGKWDPTVEYLTGITYLAIGEQERAQQILDEMLKRSQKSYIPFTYIAGFFITLGDQDQALEWLEKAYEKHDMRLAYLKVNPRYDGIRTNPRFVALLRKIGLDK